MEPVGAHEIIVETPEHGRMLADMPDESIQRVLEAYAARIADLKRDSRFKYVAVFKNQGELAGEEFPHAHSQITATTFVPRRILYELRAAREWFRERDRCVFCDILRQEERQKKRVVDSQGGYVAFCPYASRVPYEFWLMPQRHNHQFELPSPGSNRRNLAALLGRMLRRLSQISRSCHIVVHTAPNTLQTKGELSEYWKTIAGDYHWHIEVMPIVEQRSKSYSIKEIYFNGLMPELAAERLRHLDSSVSRS
jgi:UDPglucose--hexose-1-phosphate uridylyltransferase